MFDSILDSVKGEISETLKGKLGLNDSDVDKTLSSTKDALENTVASEAKANGIENLMNLFSSDNNSTSSDGILKDLGGNLLSGLLANGFSGDKASLIKNMILPIVMKFAANKIGGDSRMLAGLIGKGDVISKASGMLKGFFNK